MSAMGVSSFASCLISIFSCLIFSFTLNVIEMSVSILSDTNNKLVHLKLNIAWKTTISSTLYFHQLMIEIATFPQG